MQVTRNGLTIGLGVAVVALAFSLLGMGMVFALNGVMNSDSQLLGYGAGMLVLGVGAFCTGVKFSQKEH